MTIEQQLVDRFFRYAAVTSQSDARAAVLPSTPGQRVLAELLAAELSALGLADVHLAENAVVTARLPGTVAEAPSIGFVAHLDTVDVGLCPDIRPQRLQFDGEDLRLNAAEDIWLRVAEHPEILPYRGQDILFSDGTSVLGADNKAAIAILMTLLAELRARPAAHGDILVAFVPDEEIGLRGAKAMDLARFPAAFAYTIDSCERGELVFETFNAATAHFEIVGVPAHPMSAKGRLVNPVLLAAELMAGFDPMQTPEHTDGRDGYWWFTQIQGGPGVARLEMHIRDFDQDGFARRKRVVAETVERLQARHPAAGITCEIVDSYRNIDSALGADRQSVALLFQAMQELQITPKVLAMRGGTDGAALSARGLPTPNYFTGAHNFHSRFEFLPVRSFLDSYNVTRLLCELAASGPPPLAPARLSPEG